MSTLGKVGTVIGIIAGIFGISATIYSWNTEIFTTKPISEEILGVWSSRYSYPTSIGFNQVTATSSFFEDGNYNVKGIHMISKTQGDTSLEVTYDYSGAGEWSSKDDKLLTKLNDLKSFPIDLKINEEKIKLTLIKKFPQIKFPTIEEFLPRGTTQKYKIFKSEEDEIVLHTNDPQGNNLSYD